MSNRIVLEGIEYFAPAFDLIGEAEKMEAKIAGDVHWMAKWKIGGRAYWYRDSAKSQEIQLHRMLYWVNHFAICNCGFMADDMTESADFYCVPGHIDIETKQSVSVFHVTYFGRESKDGALKYLCQNCGVLRKVPQDLQADKVLLIQALDELRKTHRCEKK